jgi:hypothetical protein
MERSAQASKGPSVRSDSRTRAAQADHSELVADDIIHHQLHFSDDVGAD